MRKFEQYQDHKARLYPELHPIKTAQNERVLSRTVTFQVTDACNLACFVAGTKILMSDFSYKNIEDIKVGDMVIAFDEFTKKGKQLKLIPTKVTHTFIRHDYVRKITSADGEEVVCTDEHPFLDGRRQWIRAEKINVNQKLTKFLGINTNGIIDIYNENYMIGYIISAFLGDGNLAWFKHGKLRSKRKGYQNRLAVKDDEIISRICEYLNIWNIPYALKPYKVSEKYNIINNALYLNGIENSDWLKKLIVDNLNKNNTLEYYCGFLAGIIDTEGHLDESGYIRIFNSNLDILQQCESALAFLNYSYCYDKDRQSVNCTLKTIRINNPRNTTIVLSLLKYINNALLRKNYIGYYNKSYFKRENVISIELLNSYETVYNLETETHTYIANNFAVHNCTYCYQINKGHRSMSLDTAKKFIDLLLEADETNTYINPIISPFIILDFIGGEPLLEIELIDKIMDYFLVRAFELQHPWATRYCVSLCSNGVLYFTPEVQKFLNKHQYHLSLNITIDGNKELHDSCRIFSDGRPSYDLAVAAAKDWMDRGGYMGSKITIAPGNVKYVSEALTHMIDLGYTEINANCVYEEGWKIEHAKELYEQMKKFADYLLKNNLEDEIYCSLYEENFFKPKKEGDDDNWCGGTGTMLACDPDGWLYPCIRYMESSLGTDQPPLRIGHVNTGLESTVEEQKIVKCLNCITRKTQSTDECYFCPIGEGCSWCSGYNYQIFGTPDKRATFICIMHKARSLANAYFWNKVYKKKGVNKHMIVYCPKEWAVPIIGEDEYNYLIELSK